MDNALNNHSMKENRFLTRSCRSWGKWIKGM